MHSSGLGWRMTTMLIIVKVIVFDLGIRILVSLGVNTYKGYRLDKLLASHLLLNQASVHIILYLHSVIISESPGSCHWLLIILFRKKSRNIRLIDKPGCFTLTSLNSFIEQLLLQILVLQIDSLVVLIIIDKSFFPLADVV